MSRPKKQFIPTSLSDLNIDTLSLGSNPDRHNNNGGRFTNNLDRSRASSTLNLSLKHSNTTGNFSRASKMYGSQTNLSSSAGSSYQNVNNFNINSPKTSGDMDKWLEAWEENNNTYRPPSYQQSTQQHYHRQHSSDKSNQSFKIPHQQQPFDQKRTNAIKKTNQTQSNSNAQFNFNTPTTNLIDPFDDPWSGIFKKKKKTILLLNCTTQCTKKNVSRSLFLYLFINKHQSEFSFYRHGDGARQKYRA